MISDLPRATVASLRSCAPVFRHRFLNREGRLTHRELTAVTLALSAGVLDDGEREAALADLLQATRGAAVDTLPGELRPTLMGLLHEAGRGSLAQQILARWLTSWLKRPAPELAGPLLSAVLEGLAGFRLALPLLENRPGFRELTIEPRLTPDQPSAPVPSVDWSRPSWLRVGAQVTSGQLEWNWRIDEQGATTFTCQLPTDVQLKLALPEGRSLVLAAGQHQLQLPTAPSDMDGIPTLRNAVSESVRRSAT